MKDENDIFTMDYIGHHPVDYVVTSFEEGAEIGTTQSVVLKIDNRFFAKFGAKQRVITAWSIAGAKHFIPNDWRLSDAIRKLREKNITPKVVLLAIKSTQEVE